MVEFHLNLCKKECIYFTIATDPQFNKLLKVCPFCGSEKCITKKQKKLKG